MKQNLTCSCIIQREREREREGFVAKIVPETSKNNCDTAHRTRSFVYDIVSRVLV